MTSIATSPTCDFSVRVMGMGQSLPGLEGSLAVQGMSLSNTVASQTGNDMSHMGCCQGGTPDRSGALLLCSSNLYRQGNTRNEEKTSTM